MSTRQRRTAKAVLAALTALLTLGSLAACGSGGSGTNNKLKTISAGRLKVAYRTDDKPVSFLQGGKPAGFMVDVENAIAKQLGLKVTYVAVAFSDMVPAVQNHEYDTAAFGVLVTPERKAAVHFTTPISYGQAQLVSLKSAPLAKVASASGKTVAVTRGSALIPLLQKTAPDVHVKEFPNVASSTNALLAKQVDGLFTGNATAAELLGKHKEFTATQTIISGTDAMPVAKDRPELLTAINQAIAKLMKDGTYTRLFVKWNPPNVGIPDKLFSDYPGMPHPTASSSTSG